MVSRTVISTLLTGHLLALAIASVPSTDDLRQASGERERDALSTLPQIDDTVSAHVRPMLDMTAAVIATAAAGAWRLTASVRPWVSRYTNTLGLEQGWKMFGNPGRGAEYLRLRYYSVRGLTADDGPVTLATELVFPIAPDDESHTLAAFWQGHRDKAISNALSGYFRARLRRMDAGLPPPVNHEIDGALTRNFIPVVRYFATRYTRAHAERHLIRIEAWYGLAASRPRGDVPISPESRQRALARYYGRPPDQSIEHPYLPLLDTIEHEADIVWMLIYADEPGSVAR